MMFLDTPVRPRARFTAEMLMAAVTTAAMVYKHSWAAGRLRWEVQFDFICCMSNIYGLRKLWESTGCG